MNTISTLALTLAIATFTPSLSFAVDNKNPFIENADEKRDLQTEPKGVSIYSFAESPNLVTEISEDKAYLQEVNYTKSFGYAHVSEMRVTNFDELISGYRQQKQKNEKRFMHRLAASGIKAGSFNQYAFSSTDLVGHLSGNNQLLLESPSGNYIPGKGWDSSTKIINNSELGRVVFNEWNYTASDGGVIMDSNAINHYINGNRAILIIRVSESGRAETVLSWADEQKSYTIQIDNNVNEAGMMQSLHDFAEKISGAYIPMKRMER